MIAVLIIILVICGVVIFNVNDSNDYVSEMEGPLKAQGNTTAKTIIITEVNGNFSWSDFILGYYCKATLPEGEIKVGDVITNCSGYIMYRMEGTYEWFSLVDDFFADELVYIEPGHLEVSLGDGEYAIKEFVIYNKHNFTVKGTLTVLNPACDCGGYGVLLIDGDLTPEQVIEIPANGSLTFQIKIFGSPGMAPFGETGGFGVRFEADRVEYFTNWITVHAGPNVSCLSFVLLLVLVLIVVILFVVKISRKRKTKNN